MENLPFIDYLGFIGSLIGTFGGIVTSAKLTNYRIRQLEKKVDKHNDFATRIPVINKRLEFLEKEHGYDFGE